MRIPRALRILLALFFLPSAPSSAQVPREDWVERAALPPRPLLVSGSSLTTAAGGEWEFRWLETQNTLSWLPESAVNLTGNDGAAWQGRGLNLLTTGGFLARWGAVTLTLQPQFSAAQNREFELLPSTASSGFGDYGKGLDRLQRFGADPLAHFDWGNTEVRADWGPWTAGLGQEALWLGPGRHNAVLLSDNAGGFPHLDLGTRSPWKTEWGAFEAKMLWGALSDSEAWRGGAWNFDRARFLHGLVVGYSPPFLPELTAGLARVFVSPWKTLDGWKAFQSVTDTLWKRDRGRWDGTSGEEDVDQTAAVYLRLADPGLGFEVYAEIAHNDHSWDWRDLMSQPDHSLGYVAGFQQLVAFTPGWKGYFSYEQADLGLNIGTTVRPTGSWYRRGAGQPGYTLGGQMLGASIGPGSNSNDLEWGVVHDNFSVGMAFRRVAFDVDYLIKVVRPPQTQVVLYYDVATALSLQGTWRAEGWSVSAELGEAVEYGRHWDPHFDTSGYFGSVQVSVQP